MMCDLLRVSFIKLMLRIGWVIRGAMGAKASIPYYQNWEKTPKHSQETLHQAAVKLQ